MEEYYTLGTENPAVLFLALLGVFLVAFKFLIIPYLESRPTPYQGIRTCPKAHWLLGHIRMSHGRDSFPDSFLYVYRDNADENGRTGFWLARLPAISIINVQDARHILKLEFSRERAPIISHYTIKVVGRKNLLHLNGKEWRTNRAAVMRTFVHSFLVQSQQDIYDVAQDLIGTFNEKIDANEGKILELDVQPVLKMVTSDVIGKAAFDTNFDCCKTLTQSSIVGAFEYMLKDLNKRAKNLLLPWNYFFCLPIEKNRKFEEQLQILRNFIENLLKEARQKTKQLHPNSPTSVTESPSKNTKHKLSLVDRLVVANDEAETVSSDQVLIDVISTLLVASYDTTSTALTFAFYILANHPDIQEKCLEEVMDAIKSGHSLKDPGPLVYCTSVIKESLRIYPPAPITGRTTSKKVKLPSDGFVLSKGTRCVIPIFAIHRDVRIFPRPLECHPERWCQFDTTTHNWKERDYSMEQNQPVANHNDVIPAGNPDALLTFSAGARNCPGSDFALQEATLVLANMVHAFKMSPVPGYKLKLCIQGPLIFPDHGMPLRFEKR